MDPEQTFLRVHARLSGVLARLLTPKFRTVLEYLCLFNALVLLVLLVVMHVNFVAQPGCAAEFSGTEDAQLIQVKITGSSRAIEEGHQHVLHASQNSREQSEGQTSDLWKFWFYDKGKSRYVSDDLAGAETLEGQGDKEDGRLQVNAETTGPLGNVLLRYLARWSGYSASFLKSLEQNIRSFAQIWRLAGWESYATSPKNDRRAVAWVKFDSLDSLIVERVETLGKMHDPLYLYSVEKGYLILTESARVQHKIRTVNVSIGAQNACFGNRWQRFLIDNFVGYDTILMNSLLGARGKGYLYNFQTKELHNLNYLQDSSGVSRGFEDYVVFKFGVLIMSLFVFFTTTMSVSFTLRETQARMLKFTVQLQHHARHRLPTFHLIFIHVFESLVFVPIMIGILFFLFEFFDDQLLAFMVLTLVWLCELFTMISVRTRVSMQYFPRFFFLYFMVFHIYFFSYTYGFSYLAFSATAAFMQHLVLFFWNRFEVPALQIYLRRRALFQQQGLHITSSTILTQAVQLTRLNPATAPAGRSDQTGDSDASLEITGGFGGGTATGMPVRVDDDDSRSDSGHVTSDRINENTTDSSSLGVSAENAQGQSARAAANIQVTPITAFGSLFPWTLGSPSTALVSFLPIFRDLREPDSSSTSAVESNVGLRQRHRSSAENEEASLSDHR